MNATIVSNIEDGVEVISMAFGEQQAKIAVHAGNTLFSWMVRGKEKMWFPYTIPEYQKSRALAGNPFMYPWANRLEKDAIPFKNYQHSFQGAAVYRDGNGLPLHGLLLKSPYWETISMEASEHLVLHRARLDFGAVEAYMQIFPVRHILEMEHRLDKDGISIQVLVQNEDDTDLPLSFGFHPYFTYQGVDKSEVKIFLPFQRHFITDTRLIPDGQTEPVMASLREWFSILNHPLDDGFTTIEKEPVMWLDVSGEKIAVEMGDQYLVGVVYAPPAENKPYVCLEPMLAPTNALYLAQRHQWKELQWIQKGAVYSATFRLRTG